MFPVGGVDGDACPGVPEPPGAAPPPGADCATIQVAQNRSTDSSVSFLGDIMRPPALNFLAIPLPAAVPAGVRNPLSKSERRMPPRVSGIFGRRRPAIR